MTKDFESMTSAELEQHLEELKEAKEKQELKELAMLIQEESDGRFEVRVSYHGVWLYVSEKEKVLFVGSRDAWDTLKAFAKAMATPSDAEMAAHFESYEAHEDYDFTDCTFSD